MNILASLKLNIFLGNIANSTMREYNKNKENYYATKTKKINKEEYYGLHEKKLEYYIGIFSCIWNLVFILSSEY
jgi:hypothetical protein